MEIGRRLQREIAGIGLPGHFFVQYQDEEFQAWVDCFHGGGILCFEDCRKLALATAGVDILAVPGSLQPVSRWQIAVRMLENLRNVYYRKEQWEKALQVMDLLIEARPDRPAGYRERGALHLELRRPSSALADFTQYLEMEPAAGDREAVLKQVALIRQFLGSIN